MKKQLKTLLDRVIENGAAFRDLYGDLQDLKASEEASEFVTEVLKIQTKGLDADAMVEEAADVLITILPLLLHYPQGLDLLEKKLIKSEKRLAKHL